MLSCSLSLSLLARCPSLTTQVAIASHAAYPGRAVVWRKRVHSRMWLEYGGRGFRELPTVHDAPESFMCSGDVLIAPDVRTDACAPWLVERNVTLFTYVLSINFLPILLRAAARHPQHCRFLSHSHALAEPSSLWHSSPTRHQPASVVRPYISPSIAAACAAARQRPSKAKRPSDRPPLVLLDSDSPGEVRFHASRACNVSSGASDDGSATRATAAGSIAPPSPPLCTVLWVHRLPRSKVMQLLEEASIVVDMCMVGTERLPVEAALCGAVLVTSSCRKGHGADARDFPLPAGSVLSNATGLGAAFQRVLANFDDEQRGMSALVKLYDSSAQEQGTGSTSSALDERGAGAQPTASARSMARELGYALRGFL